MTQAKSKHYQQGSAPSAPQNPSYYPTQQGPYHPPPAQHQQMFVVTDHRSAAAAGGFGVDPVQTTCTNCHQTVTTVVDSKVKDGGWFWCLFCTLFFSICVGCLAFCLNGFKKFMHRCPKCNMIITEVEPEITKKEKIIIGGVVGLVILQIVIIVIACWILMDHGFKQVELLNAQLIKHVNDQQRRNIHSNWPHT